MEEKPIAVICPMAEERASVIAMLDRPQAATIAGLSVVAGSLAGRPVVIAESGIGKVAAAVTAALLAQEARALVVSGVAGGLDPQLAIGDVVIADSFIQHDYGQMTRKGLRAFRPGEPPLGDQRRDPVFALPEDLLADLRQMAATIDLPPLPAEFGAGRARRLFFGRIASGDQFVNDEAMRRRLHSDHAAMAVEMEGAAIAQVGEMFALPVIVARSISDLAGAESHCDFPRFLEVVAPAAALIIRHIVARL